MVVCDDCDQCICLGCSGLPVLPEDGKLLYCCLSLI